RLEIDEIRGVNSSGAIATLTERSLATVVGRSQTVGNPLLYGTTREFLNHLGLKGLGQLPELPAIESLLDDREQLKAFASRIGRDVSDDELDGFLAGDGEDEAEVLVDPADGPDGPDAAGDPQEPAATEMAAAATEADDSADREDDDGEDAGTDERP
ncbi:MAG: SMC-Scp complex subunit ScpB, partial [Candidatus Krumholzibacteriia bacterium]